MHTDFQIGIIGTGRVARALAFAFSHRCSGAVAIWGRDTDAARAIAAAHPAMTALDTRDALIDRCAVLALAVRDDAIAPLATMLARLLETGAPRPHAPLVFHLSGACGLQVLAPLQARGAKIAAIHPAMTFTGHPQAEFSRMNGAHFAVTPGDVDARAQALYVVRLLGGIAVEIGEDQRTLYHAALCHGANHLVTLIAGAMDMLRGAGFSNPGTTLGPLVRAALDNTLEHGLEALSGPLLRGDAQTVTGHLSALQNSAPGALPAYRAMALATLGELQHTQGRDQGADADMRHHLSEDVTCPKT